MITKAGHNSDEIHIVFDNYREDSIKKGIERGRPQRPGPPKNLISS